MKLVVNLLTPPDNISVAWDGAWFYTDTVLVGLIPNADGGSSFDVTLTVDILLENLNSIERGAWHIKTDTQLWISSSTGSH